MEQEAGLRCLKCGYALRGLPARKCGDCGHVYLRCPECGASQIANEAQNRLLLQMRARAAKLPGWIQGSQIIFLVIIGVVWTAIGFLGGAASREMDLTGHLVMGGMAVLSACLVRLLVFHLRNALTAAGSAMAFVMIPFALGEFCAWGNVRAEMACLLALAAYVVGGAGIGAWGAEVIGWVILWMFAKDEDRMLMTRAYQGALSDRLLHGVEMRPARNLMYCTHCAAELPALTSSTCSDCRLEQVTCPTCGKHCGVSDALGALLSVGSLTQSVWAGFWVAVRMPATAVMWIWLVSRADEIIRHSSWLAGRGGAVVSVDPFEVMSLLPPVVILTWFVFRRGAVSVALLCMGTAFTVGWFARENGFRSVGPPWIWFVILPIGAGTASLLASFLGWLVRASLPTRRIAMLEEVVPELAREEAQS